jgi:hypothetical protein
VISISKINKQNQSVVSIFDFLSGHIGSNISPKISSKISPKNN